MKVGAMHKTTVEKLKNWDKSKTLKENAIKLAIREDSARHFAIQYHLGYKMVKPRIDWSKWNENLTLKENVDKIGCSYSTALNKARYNELKYRRLQRGLSCDLEKKILAISLKEKGYTYEAIGKLFGGISRQAVEQLVSRKVKKIDGPR